MSNNSCKNILGIYGYGESNYFQSTFSKGLYNVSVSDKEGNIITIEQDGSLYAVVSLSLSDGILKMLDKAHDDAVLAEIEFPNAGEISNVKFNEETNNIEFNVQTLKGEVQAVELDVNALVDIYEAGQGIEISEKNEATGKKPISIKLASNEKLLQLNDEGLSLDEKVITEDELDDTLQGYKVTMDVEPEHDNISASYIFKQGENEIGRIDIAKDLVVKEGELIIDEDGKPILVLTLNDENATKISIDLTKVFDKYLEGDGITIENNVVGIKLDPESDSYIAVGENGLKVSGIKQEFTKLNNIIGVFGEDEGTIKDILDSKVNSVELSEELSRIDDEIGELQASVGEVSKFKDIIDTNTAEIATNKESIKNLGTEISNEVTRATGVENEIKGMLGNFTGGGSISDAIQEVKDSVAQETANREAKDTELTEKIDNVEAKFDIKNTEITGKIDTVDAKVDAAEEKITANKNGIDAEVNRATSAETALGGKIDAEVSNRENAIQEVKDSIAQEATDRKAKDTELGNKIDTKGEELKTYVDEQVKNITGLDTAFKQDISTKVNDVTLRVQNVEQGIKSEETARIAKDDAIDKTIAEIRGEYYKKDEVDSKDNGIKEEVITQNETYTQNYTDGKITDLEARLREAITQETKSLQDAITTNATKISVISNLNGVEGDNSDGYNDSGNGILDTLHKEFHDFVNGTDSVTDEIISNNVAPKFEEVKNLINSVDTRVTDLGTVVDTKANSDDVYTKDETDTKISDAINGIIDNAPAEYNTLKKISDYITSDIENATNASAKIEENTNSITTINNTIPTLATKDELAGYVTTEAHDKIVAEKEAEITSLNNDIYALKQAVGNMGGDVTYNFPSGDVSFKAMMRNNGTVQLTKNVTVEGLNPGMIDSNKTHLELRWFDLTITGLTNKAGILADGTQEITIAGTAIIDAGTGICVGVRSAGAVINLEGLKTRYYTNRPGGELIYAESGTINIKGGIFKNNGSKYLLNCNDENYRAGTAKIIVSGGTFYDFDPGNNEAEGPHTSFLAEGYVSTPKTVIEDGVEHTTYVVTKSK